MNAETMDFSVILSNMEAKRAALDAAIASLRAAMASGALGGMVSVPGESTIHPPSPSNLQGNYHTSGVDIPNGAFHGKTVTEAVKAYLGTIKKKQKTRQIVEALRKGGIESSSDKFLNIVYNALSRMQNVSGEVVKVGTEWGLAEWFPPGMRAQPKPLKSRAGTRKQTRAPQTKNANTVATNGHDTIPSRIEELLSTHPEKLFTPSEIAGQLNIEPIAVNVRLKRMLARGRILKEGYGQYRAGKSAVVKMPVAG
jgi:hypothetical protein